MPPVGPVWLRVTPGAERSKSIAIGSLRCWISSLGMMLTLPPCRLASTSMAEPATRTESTIGARSSRTVISGTASSAAMDLAAKPGAVITSLEPRGKEHANAPSGDGKQKKSQRAYNVPTHSKLLPREPCELTPTRLLEAKRRPHAGRSPDLRLIGSFGLPIPLPEQWRLRRALRAYSSGAVPDFHRLPEHQRKIGLPSECTLSLETDAELFCALPGADCALDHNAVAGRSGLWTGRPGGQERVPGGLPARPARRCGGAARRSHRRVHGCDRGRWRERGGVERPRQGLPGRGRAR